MALYMPTFIHPDSRWGIGNGTIDVNEDLEVRWLVNGNSPMTQYSITIYTNDENSTQVYTTGNQTTNCPFYNTTSPSNSAETEQVFFTHTITSAAMTGAGMANGGEYKLLITQYWSMAESITQASASAFITRATPSLIIDSVPSPLTERLYTFTAEYTQADGDVLNWIRWQIAESGNEEEPFYDTGNIYGATDLTMDYDGFFKDTVYSVRCTGQTENGIECDTGWQDFMVSYDSSPLTGFVNAQRMCNLSAIKVSWPNVSYIGGSATGNYRLRRGRIVMFDGASVTWGSVNGQAMGFAPPWSIFYSGELRGMDVTLFAITTIDGNLSLSYSLAARTLSLTMGATTLQTINDVDSTADVVAVITPDAFWLHLAWATGGLYPSETLYPSNTLYPRDNAARSVSTTSYPLSYTQSKITDVAVYGESTCEYLQIIEGTAEQSDINDAVYTNTYSPTFEDGVYFYAGFEDGLYAGNLNNGETLTGYAVYRAASNESILQKIAEVGITDNTVYDFSAKSQMGYVYYVFPLDSTTYVTEPLVSDTVSPCFWNWTVLETEKQSDGSYLPISEYDFGKNLSSGAISNGNTPSISATFTRYPNVQLSPQNYQSGTLTSLIGWISQTKYSDSIELRDAIWALSTSNHHLFLKTPKGDLMKIRTAGAISMTTQDNSREQAQTVALPWTEVESAHGMSIVAYTTDEIIAG